MSQTDALFSTQSQTILVSVTTTASASAALPGQGNTVRIVNEGPNVAYVSIGATAQTATLPSGTAVATCTAILPSSDITMSIPDTGRQNISAVTRTGTASLNVQVGEGS